VPGTQERTVVFAGSPAPAGAAESTSPPAPIAEIVKAVNDARNFDMVVIL